MSDPIRHPLGDPSRPKPRLGIASAIRRLATCWIGSLMPVARASGPCTGGTPVPLTPVPLLVALMPLLPGCVERTISITSEPPGALVWISDQEVGRTPVEVSFLHYGTYDVRVVAEGYEAYSGPAAANPPLYDLPGPDLVAEILPIRFRSRVYWHFDLEPTVVEPEALVERAKEMRGRLGEERE